MVMTRDEGWKEIKLARLFHQGRSDRVQQELKSIDQEIRYRRGAAIRNISYFGYSRIY